MQVPIYNGNANGGVFALGSIYFQFDHEGTVSSDLNVRTYKLNGLMDMNDGETMLRVRLELVVFVFWGVLFWKAIGNLRKTGPHLMNVITIVSSSLFMAIIFIWAMIAYVSVFYQIRSVDPMEGDTAYSEAVIMLGELVGITFLYDFYALLNIGFCILALARCFLILSFHKRLSILTETLWEG